MAKTPVSMTIDGYKEREVLMVTYEFSQATDVEGQMQPAEERRDQVLGDEDEQGDEEHQVHQRLLHQLRREVGGQDGSLRRDRDHL